MNVQSYFCGNANCETKAAAVPGRRSIYHTIMIIPDLTTNIFLRSLESRTDQPANAWFSDLSSVGTPENTPSPVQVLTLR